MNIAVKPFLQPKLQFKSSTKKGTWTHRMLGEFLVERSEYPQVPTPLYSLTIESGVTPKTERYERSFLVRDQKDAYKLMLPNDFAFNPMNLRFGAIGRHAGLGPVAVSKYYNIFYCDPSVCPAFCDYYFRSEAMVSYYDDMAIGSLIEKRRVHFGDFLKFRIPFPSLSEQRKIADCLNSLDELIGGATAKLEALRLHKQGLMDRLFPREGENRPQLRFAEFKKASDWITVCILDACQRVMDGTHFSPKSKSGPRMYLTSKNVRDGRLDLSTACYISEEEHQHIYQRCPVKLHDVLLTKDGANTGTCAINTLGDEFSLLSSVAVLRGKPSIVRQDFLYYLIASERTQKQIAASISGQAITRITLQKLGGYQVSLPCLAEQRRISSCLRAVDDLITAQSQHLRLLKTHHRGLVQQLFPMPEL